MLREEKLIKNERHVKKCVYIRTSAIEKPRASSFARESAFREQNSRYI